MKFKNDKERIAFLEDYRNEENGWYLFKEIEDMQRRWWRFDLPDCALIVEEDRMTFEWPERHVGWYIRNWFIIKDWTFSEETFRDQVASRSMAMRELKRVEKEMKNIGEEENR